MNTSRLFPFADSAAPFARAAGLRAVFVFAKSKKQSLV
jgi:hypothetical protein